MLTLREVLNYVRILLRWWWVLVIAGALAAGSAFILVARQPNYYVAQATLMVGDTLNSATPDTQLMGVSSVLTNFYAEMARREPILGPVAERLNLGFPWQVISSFMLSTSVNRNANLLDITITDTNPERAAAITMAIADELVRYSPNSPEKIADQRALVDEQITEAELTITDLERKITETRDQLAQVSGAADLRETRARLAELEQTLQTTRATYNQLVLLKNSSVANTLSVLEPARVPTSPIPNKRLLTVAIAGGAGIVLAIVAIFLLEFLDDRWRGGGDVNGRFGLSILGTVPGKQPLLRTAPALAHIRESAVRETHTQIVLAGVASNSRTIMVSSPRPSEARSALTLDLAHQYTRSGYRVLLVDADSEIANLTNLLSGSVEQRRPVVVYNGEPEIWSNLQATPIKNVMLLGHNIGPDGRPLPPSLPWPALVENLNRAADVIIFDGPSALLGVDAALLSPLVDSIVLALDPTVDRREDIVQSRFRLTRTSGANLLGVVVLAAEAEMVPVAVSNSQLLPTLARRMLGAKASATTDAPQPDAPRVIITPPANELADDNEGTVVREEQDSPPDVLVSDNPLSAVIVEPPPSRA